MCSENSLRLTISCNVGISNTNSTVHFREALSCLPFTKEMKVLDLEINLTSLLMPFVLFIIVEIQGAHHFFPQVSAAGL